MARLPLVSPLDRILFLKAQPYLAGQPPEVLTALASYTEDRYYDAGSVVRPAGKKLEEIHFLAEGSVEIIASVGARARRIDAPGVIGIPHAAVRASDAPEIRCITDTLLLAISVVEIDQILDDHSTLLLNFARRTAEQALNGEHGMGDRRPDMLGFSPEDEFGTPVELDLVHRLARARRAPFFQDTNLTLLGQLIRYEEVRHVASGAPLWSIGDRVESMTLVLDGRFESRGPFPLAYAPAGAVIGAFEILGESPREESWVACVASRVLRICRDDFVDLLEDHPEFVRAYHAYCSRATLIAWDDAVRHAAPLPGPDRITD